MKLEQIRWGNDVWDVVRSEIDSRDQVQLVLVFGHPDSMKAPERFDELRGLYPNANIVGASTAGNVLDADVSDDDIVATAVFFEKSRVRVISSEIEDVARLRERTSALMLRMKAPDLKHILVLSEGVLFNGSELAKGLNVIDNIAATGGLAGDQGRFKETYVMANGPAKTNNLVLIGFYGEALEAGYGCFAGWGEFGVDRIISKSEGNVVYEIDGKPALALYKKYLGNFSEQLPASGLRFPLSIRREETDHMLIRTLLGVDEEKQSLTFAGDVPEGSITLLMKGNIDDLIKSAGEAAKEARLSSGKRGLAVVISCVGRKILMDQMTVEELEVVQEQLGVDTWMTGFYSYGELAPYNKTMKQCDLHNQTMTLTTITEE